MIKSALLLIFVGLVCVFYAQTIPVYKDEIVYKKALDEINRSLYEDTYVDEYGQPDPRVEYNYKLASKRYFRLRNDQLSHRYFINDIALSIVVFGIALLCIGIIGWRKLTAPTSRKLFIVLALLAGLSMLLAEGLGLIHGVLRGEAPSWADSIGIPLFSLIMASPIMIFLSMLFCTMLAGNYTNGVRLVELRLRVGTILPLFGTILMCVLIALILFDGYFWMIPPACLWLYLFLSVAAGRTPVCDEQ